MVDFDTIDKYVAAVKRGGVAIQMKQFHNLDRFIEEVVYDFKEYADIDLTEEQKEYIAATVSGDESYEHLINKNGENEDLHRSFCPHIRCFFSIIFFVIIGYWGK